MGQKASLELSTAWVNFIRFCERVGFGELDRVQIQNGVPVSAESVKEKVKFTESARKPVTPAQ